MESKTALKNQGFTLIELLVSLLVISILVSLGYANFRKYAQKQALWAVARQIEGDLRLAQSYAMSGKDASCSSGYLYGYQLVKVDNSSYKIQRVCRNPDGGSFTFNDVPPVRYISGFEIYNSFSPVLFRSVVGGVDSATSINIRRISTTSPYILVNVSLTGTISLSYNE
jgi:prepilin-type N-terminal cleavage/methylation domain-containing protein